MTFACGDDLTTKGFHCLYSVFHDTFNRYLSVWFQKRDLRAVGKKFFHVLIPRQSKSLLRDCKINLI